MTMFQQVHQLLDLITKSVDTLEQVCSGSKTELPSLDKPWQPACLALWTNPIAAEAVAVISAAALHLNAIVSPPQNMISSTVAGHFRSAAIRVCLEGSITEILREAGPEGLHVDDIAAKNGLDAQKLSRCMRMMATHHIYREVKPDVFTNNRISSLLDTMKPSAEIIADPFHKYDNAGGMATTAGISLAEQSKASAYIWETVSDPKTAKSDEPNEAPFARGVSNGKTFWEWIGQPENVFSQRRFECIMHGAQAHVTNAPIITAYDWKSLPANSLIVDVGGGVGTACLALAKEFPNLKFVVQDRQPVVEAGAEVWKKELPEALSSSRVQLQAHDFFAPQPQTDASIFLVKNVLHDWSDKYSLKILKQLRGAASPGTKLVILEMIMRYTCHGDTDEIVAGITSSTPIKAPSPLLANWGAVNDLIYILDMTMLTLCHSRERTIRQFDQLLRGAGWKITAVRRRPGVDFHLLSSIIAVPI